MKAPAALVAWVLALSSGCATAPPRATPELAPPTASTPVATPPPPVPVRPDSAMHDLDVVPRAIPPALLEDMIYPYRRPEPGDCAALAAGVAELDALLGEDLDAPDRQAASGNVVAHLFLGGVRSAIPYFGLLRRITGVERRERRAISAAAAGFARRGYLKGLAQAQGCTPPAAPYPPPPPAAPPTPDAPPEAPPPAGKG